MSNIFNFILKGEANGDESPSNISDEGQAPKAQAPQLTKEQLRERRLGKLGGSGPAAGAPEIQQKEAEKEQASLKMDIPPSSPTKVAATNGSSNNNNSSTSSSSTPATPLAAGGSGTTTPIAQKPSPLTSPRGANGANTPTNNERVLNMALEGVFLFSLRPASSVSMSLQQGGGMSGPQVKFMGDENSPTRLLNSANLTEALLERLSDTQDGVGSSVNYLVGSYKRILQKEGALKDATRTEFLGCKSQCVNFIVTALTEPDTFSPNSDNSMTDLVQLLKDDTSPHISPFLRDLAEELERQGSLSEVVEGIVSSCFDGMNGGSSSSEQQSLMESMALMTGQPAPPKMRSILDASTSGPVGVVRALCLADKRLAKAVSEQSCFQLEPSLATAKPGRPSRQPAQNMQHLFGFAAPPANQQASSGPLIVQGAAVADTTLLGRMLRNVVDSRDPTFRQMFENVHLGVPRNVLESNFARLRGPLNSAQIAVNDALLSMLKAGSAKEVALTWIQQAIVCNAENSKDEPDLRIGASRGFLLQLSGVLLRLCRPFLHDADKILSKVDWRYLVQPENASVFSREETGLFTRVVAPQHPPSNPAPAGTNAFMTQTMFYTARCLHLSLSPMIRRMKNCARHVHHLREELQNSDPRAINVLMQLMVYQTELLNEDLLSMTVDYCGALATLLLGALNGSSSSSGSGSSIGSIRDEESGSTGTILGKEQFTVQQKEVLSALPEYLVMDMFEFLNFVADYRADLLGGSPFMGAVLELIIFFLRRPSAVLSPHLRATLGVTLFCAFLPGEARDASGLREREGTDKDGSQCTMIESSLSAQRYLAPALLLLYGDVERTGHYEKIDHRRKLGVLLKYLWSLPSHRDAFRDIANAASSEEGASDEAAAASAMDIAATTTADGADEEVAPEAFDDNYFVRFANGIMNETNAQVNEALSNLSEIHKIETLKATAEWAGMSEETRKQHEEKLTEAEAIARQAAGLCNNTIHMVNFLTSDEAIVVPFLKPEILPRFTSMLLNVVSKLTGAKSLELKVADQASYNFDPKNMLREICLTILHVCQYDAFCDAVANDGFYNEGGPLTDAIKVVSRLGLVSIEQQQQLSAFKERTESKALGVAEMDAISEEAPMEYMDPLLSILMMDPVLLRTSGTIVDRYSISQQMLNDPVDPFNRAPITQSDIIPQPELKATIQAWINDKRAERAAARAKEVDAAGM